MAKRPERPVHTMCFVEMSAADAARLGSRVHVTADSDGVLTIRTHKATKAQLRDAINADTAAHGMRTT